MAILNESIKDVIGDKGYYNLLARMMIPELKGREEKYTQKQVLREINEMLISKGQEPYTLYWLKKHW